MRKTFFLGVSLLIVAFVAAGCSGGSDDSGASSNGETGAVTFVSSIYPVLEANCSKCHIDKTRGEFSVIDLASVMAGGESGDAVVPGNAEESLLYQLVTDSDAKERMPRKADALSAQDIATIKTWIDSGAH